MSRRGGVEELLKPAGRDAGRPTHQLMKKRKQAWQPSTRIVELILAQGTSTKYLVICVNKDFVVFWLRGGTVERRMLLNMSSERAVDMNERLNGSGERSDIDVSALEPTQILKFGDILARVVEEGSREYIVSWEKGQLYVYWLGEGHVDRRVLSNMPRVRQEDLKKRYFSYMENHGDQESWSNSTALESGVDLEKLEPTQLAEFNKQIALMPKVPVEYIISHEQGQFYVLWLGEGGADRCTVQEMSTERAVDLRSRLFSNSSEMLQSVDYDALEVGDEFNLFARLLRESASSLPILAVEPSPRSRFHQSITSNDQDDPPTTQPRVYSGEPSDVEKLQALRQKLTERISKERMHAVERAARRDRGEGSENWNGMQMDGDQPPYNNGVEMDDDQPPHFSSGVEMDDHQPPHFSSGVEMDDDHPPYWSSNGIEWNPNDAFTSL